MAETIEARVAFLQNQVHAINLAVQQAKGRGDQAAIASLGVVLKKVQQQLADLKEEALGKDMPSQFMLTLSGISDEVTHVAQEITHAGVEAVKGAAGIVKALPIILAVALIVVGLVYAGKLRKDLK